jgi:hypothetical protein
MASFVPLSKVGGLTAISARIITVFMAHQGTESGSVRIAALD